MTFALPIPKRAKMAVRMIGGHVEPPTDKGGVVQRFTNVGSGKFALDITCPPMEMDEAAPLIGGLLRAQREEVTLPWPQPRLAIGAPGARTVGVASSSNATVLDVAGGAAYLARALQYFNLVGPDGRLYLHALTQANQIPGSILIAPATRIEADAGLSLDFATPKIQGFVEGDVTTYTVDTACHAGVAFSIVERK